jgi:2-methylisocitrate lyase-like PEP mutase family enzyme
MPASAASALRAVLARPGLHVMPCCFDAHSARLIERAGFALTFMSGFAVSAARIGQPDTGLISYGEMLDQGRNICSAVNIPVIGDGDTGYGNALNVKRTVAGYAAAGFACAMIEDPARAEALRSHARQGGSRPRRGRDADSRGGRRARGGRAGSS